MADNSFDVIIIGAGASGLMAMKTLVSEGLSVAVLEAASKAGGRIHTVFNDESGVKLEEGAEFVHGDLPLTLQLLKQAKIPYEKIGDKMFTFKKGDWEKGDDHNRYWNTAMRKMKELSQDDNLRHFLQVHFHQEKYRQMCSSMERYAQGFDLADPQYVSVKSLYMEWSNEDDNQYRIVGGYVELINYLQLQAETDEVQFFFNSPVKHVAIQDDKVTVTTNDEQVYTADKVLLTVSVAILQSHDIVFFPALNEHLTAINQLAFGTVIKILLEFSEPFWEEQHKGVGFIISDEDIPTWWTQAPSRSSLLTGWLGGPPAFQASQETTTSLLNKSLTSLSSIFGHPVAFLEAKLKHSNIAVWHNNPFVMGGYSYNTVHSDEAKKILAEPVLEKIYFAGEAFYTGNAQGTVEAALQSGQQAGQKIAVSCMKSSKS